MMRLVFRIPKTCLQHHNENNSLNENMGKGIEQVFLITQMANKQMNMRNSTNHLENKKIKSIISCYLTLSMNDTTKRIQ